MAPTTRNQASGPIKASASTIHQDPETPSKRGKNDLYDFLDYFSSTFNLNLPVRAGNDTPSSRPKTVGNELVTKLTLLFYRDKDALHQMQAELTWLPNLDMLPDRLDIIFRKVDQLWQSVVQHVARTPSRRTPSPLKQDWNRQEQSFEAPPSPTLGVKHAPPQMLNTSVPHLPSLAPAKSATTSFATTAATSFMSDTSACTKASQSTAATSVSGGFDATQKTDFPASSWAPSQVERLEAAIAQTASSKMPDLPLKIAPRKPNEHHRIAKIPEHGLTEMDLDPSLHGLPTYLAAEAYRVMRARNSTPKELKSQWGSKRTLQSLHKLIDKSNISRRFKRGFETDYSDHTLCAKLRWSTKKDGPVFDLDLFPPRKEDSNAFQRKFGGDRILVIDLPDLNRLPSSFKGQPALDCVLEMFAIDQKFLGRRWLQYHVKKKKGSELDAGDSGSYQVSLIALDGEGLEPIDFVDFISWALPLSENAHQAACKAYARLDLAASRGRATLIFEPDQIIDKVPDVMSSDWPDDESFNDPRYRFMPKPEGWRVEMTDGCCGISLAAMKQVQVFLGLKYLPTVIQARIFGAKGMWYLDLSDDGKGRTTNEIWIKIRFVPILTGCCVPDAAILNIVREQVDFETKEFLDALQDPPQLRDWVHKQKDLATTRRANRTIPAAAGFPSSTDERVTMMLEHGYDPKQCAYLKKQVVDVGEHVFSLKAKRFKIRLGKSTMLYGIADPTGKLKPGEVCIFLSQPFTDPASGQTFISLHGLEILVARNPSLRNADIQKVRAVFVPELAHFQDVIVFSVQGPRPLASKLSGGDYDGDTFWICWEPTLVQPFKNAPAPWTLRSVEDFGITVDRVKLGTIIPSGLTGFRKEVAVREWIQRSTAARMRANLLGTVTLFHAKFVYDDGSITSEKADMLVDLHDHLVDADKQGFGFDEATWSKWRVDQDILLALPKPAYWKFTGREGDRKVETMPKASDTTDCLFYIIVEPEVKQTMTSATAIMLSANAYDADLCDYYKDLESSTSEVIRAELSALMKTLREEVYKP